MAVPADVPVPLSQVRLLTKCWIWGMVQKIKEHFKEYDYFILFLLFSVSAISFFAIYSAVYEPTENLIITQPFRQMKVFAGCIFLFVAISIVGYMRIVRLAPIFYVIGLVLLIWVHYRGIVGMGAQRWLRIGFIRGQPSEIFKVVWVLMLAWIFSDLQDKPLGLLKLAIKFLWLIPPFILVYKQPDLGTSLTYVAMWGLVTVFLGVKRAIIAITLILGLAMVPVVWSKLEPYQKMRVVSFISPDKDTGNSGYQALQSRIAIGSGGISGKGYLKGTQSHLRFMPERHTDFIFAVINEEFGFIGGAAIISILLILVIRIINISSLPKEPKGKVLCIAVASLIFFQYFINTSMTVGFAPIVGIPLPFVSYGGSALLSFVCMLGLVNSVYMHRNDNF
jgi:rod shape determining protein RodA